MAERLQITVVYSPAPGQIVQWALQLPAGSTLGDALIQWRAQGAAKAPQNADAGLWGRVLDPATVLRDGDRIEVYRPLKVDPKEARRQRFVAQGKRSAGLFAR